MPTETRTMKLAVTNETEIEQLKDLCSQIEEFGKELRTFNYRDIDLTDDKDYYTILYPIWKGSENIEDFMEAVFKEFDAVHHGRILFNLSTLLDNCADKTLTHLDFNEDIKKGLGILESHEVFDKTKFSGLQQIKIKDNVYDLMSVDFEERLVAYNIPTDEDLKWARFENVELIEAKKQEPVSN